MRNETEEVKYCKSKDCKKILPARYKHNYCEACRNKHAENTRITIKAILGTVASVFLVLNAGKINPKNK